MKNIKTIIDEWFNNWKPIEANKHILEINIKQSLAKELDKFDKEFPNIGTELLRERLGLKSIDLSGNTAYKLSSEDKRMNKGCGKRSFIDSLNGFDVFYCNNVHQCLDCQRKHREKTEALTLKDKENE